MRTKLYSFIALSLAGITSLSSGAVVAGDLDGEFLHVDTTSTAIQSANSHVLRGVSLIDQPTSHRDGDYTVASVSLQDNSGNAAGSLITVKKDDGSFVAWVDTPFQQGTVIRHQHGSQVFISMPANDFMQHDSLEALAVPSSGFFKAATGDIDSKGVAVIDLLAGFSTSSAKRVGDATAYAIGQVESVNQALRNSNITTVRLRLAGVQIIPQDYPITGSTLKKVSTLFAEGMRQYGADVVAGFFNGGEGGSTAAGIAFTGGWYSIQHVNSPNAFRHEIAHNVGGSHCNTGQARYTYGYYNGKSKSVLCGNSTAYYSTPLLTDEHGLPRGNADTADMARLWRDRANAMSSRTKAVIPLN